MVDTPNTSNREAAIDALRDVHDGKMEAARSDGTSPRLEAAIAALTSVEAGKAKAASKRPSR
jgi:hypothetical protein